MFTMHPTIADVALVDPRMIAPDSKLPARYREICTQQNGGFLQRFSLATSEPTSDGLAHVECHYLAGIATDDTIAVIDRSPFPDYLVPFSQHQTQYFAFDYQQTAAPSIRYIDTEVDQWLTVATSFDTFLAQLGTKAIDLTALEQHPLTPLQRSHYLLIAQPTALTQLLDHYAIDSPKDWFLNWLIFFAQHGTLAQQTCALKAFDTQQLYFRRQLPQQLVTKLQLIFSQQPAVTTLYQQYQTKW